MQYYFTTFRQTPIICFISSTTLDCCLSWHVVNRPFYVYSPVSEIGTCTSPCQSLLRDARETNWLMPKTQTPQTHPQCLWRCDPQYMIAIYVHRTSSSSKATFGAPVMYLSWWRPYQLGCWPSTNTASCPLSRRSPKRRPAWEAWRRRPLNSVCQTTSCTSCTTHKKNSSSHPSRPVLLLRAPLKWACSLRSCVSQVPLWPTWSHLKTQQERCPLRIKAA